MFEKVKMLFSLGGDPKPITSAKKIESARLSDAGLPPVRVLFPPEKVEEVVEEKITTSGLLPDWAYFELGKIVLDRDVVYPMCQRLFGHTDKTTDQFWLEVYRRCLSTYIRDKVIEAENMHGMHFRPISIRFNGGNHKWRLANWPATDKRTALMGAEGFRGLGHYDKFVNNIDYTPT
jgi:hypothetical protein